MCLYWIYSANNWGVLFTWWGVCVPFGHRVGSLIFLRYVFVLDIFCQQLWGVVHLMGCLCALRAQGWVMYNKRDNCNIRRTSTRRTSARPFLMLSKSARGTSARQTSAREDKCQGDNCQGRTSARGTRAREDKCQEDKCQAWYLSYWHLSRGNLSANLWKDFLLTDLIIKLHCTFSMMLREVVK